MLLFLFNSLCEIVYQNLTKLKILFSSNVKVKSRSKAYVRVLEVQRYGARFLYLPRRQHLQVQKSQTYSQMNGMRAKVFNCEE